MEFNAKTIDAIEVPDKPLEIRHPKCTGLLLRVQPGTGLKTWYWEHRTGGRKSRIKIGRYPETTITRAVAQATRYRTQLLDGHNPAEDRRVAKQSPKLSELVDEYEVFVMAHHKSGDKTILRLRRAFECLQDRRVLTIDVAAITSWRTWRKSTVLDGARGPAGACTINKDLRAVHSMFNWAVQHKRIARNPILGIKRLETEDHPLEMRTLSDAEERAVLAILDAQRATLPDGVAYQDAFYPCIVCALDTGIRQGEMLALDWRYVDLANGKITMHGSTTKAKKTRVIPMTPRVRQVLTDWRIQTGGTGLVFQIGASSLGARWRALCAEAGIVGVRWHDLRHTFGTRLAMRGVPSVVIMRLMGHSSLKITERYLHALDTSLVDAIAQLEQ